MRHFGPPHAPGRVDGMRAELTGIVTGLIDALAGRNRVDIVEDIAYPFPVTVICRLLGVPREDEPRFHVWADAIVAALGPGEDATAERRRRRDDAAAELRRYLGGLADARRAHPGDDLISGLVTRDGPEEPMADADVAGTGTLLLIAGHETTVNLITNGMLTLLRHPDVLERAARRPRAGHRRSSRNCCRYEPPVHFPATRVALDDIEIAGTTIPRGSPIVLALAAGSRDPGHVSDPGRFDPARDANEHLGFGGGIHYCFGAPLARLEAQIALTELARRLGNPRLVADPPPYRPSPSLRGPRHLLVTSTGSAEHARERRSQGRVRRAVGVARADGFVADEQPVVQRCDRRAHHLGRVGAGGQLAAQGRAGDQPRGLLVPGGEEGVQVARCRGVLHGGGDEGGRDRAVVGIGEPVAYEVGEGAQVAAERAGVGDRPGLAAGHLQGVRDQARHTAPPPVHRRLVHARAGRDAVDGQPGVPLVGQLGEGRRAYGLADARGAPAGPALRPGSRLIPLRRRRRTAIILTQPKLR